jgi:hypothetical protein
LGACGCTPATDSKKLWLAVVKSIFNKQ